MSLKGVYTTKKKDGTVYYRASFTYKAKHIALGSFDTEEEAAEAYDFAVWLIQTQDDFDEIRKAIADGNVKLCIGFDKVVTILNYRYNGMYLPNPIFVRKRFFSYYLSVDEELKFSADDLFYYMNHKILRRGGHMYVNDYGMQITLGLRYGIKAYAVEGRDYMFVNGDNLDYRYENINIINTYNGVSVTTKHGKQIYKAKIHINGDYVVGYYDDAVTAAIAYNKAIDMLRKNNIKKEYVMNYVEEIGAKMYADIYSAVDISEAIKQYQG